MSVLKKTNMEKFKKRLALLQKLVRWQNQFGAIVGIIGVVLLFTALFFLVFNSPIGVTMYTVPAIFVGMFLFTTASLGFVLFPALYEAEKSNLPTKFLKLIDFMEKYRGIYMVKQVEVISEKMGTKWCRVLLEKIDVKPDEYQKIEITDAPSYFMQIFAKDPKLFLLPIKLSDNRYELKFFNLNEIQIPLPSIFDLPD